MIPEEKLKDMKERAYQNKVKIYKRHLINKKDNIQYIRNKNLNLVRIGNRKINCLRWGSNETKEHILKKLEICMKLKKSGHEFITEAIFENGSRCDILDLDLGEVWEVLESEKLGDCRDKAMNYPRGLKLIFVKCKNNGIKMSK